jgi:integrase
VLAHINRRDVHVIDPNDHPITDRDAIEKSVYDWLTVPQQEEDPTLEQLLTVSGISMSEAYGRVCKDGRGNPSMAMDRSSISRDMKLRDLLVHWPVSQIEGLGPYTIHHYTTLIERVGNSAIGDKPIGDLRPDDIASYCSQMRRDLLPDRPGGPPARMVMHHLQMLRMVLRLAVDQGLLDHNPASEIVLPRPYPIQVPMTSSDGVMRLIRLCRGSSLYVPLMMVVGTRMRLREVLQTRGRDVDLVGGTITVRGDVADSGPGIPSDSWMEHRVERRLVLTPALGAALGLFRTDDGTWECRGEMPSPDQLLCVGANGEPLSSATLSMRFRGWLNAAGLPYMQFYDLRALQGADLPDDEEWPRCVDDTGTVAS